MNCPTCCGKGWVRGPAGLKLCHECQGFGVYSCCDAAGSADLARAAYRDDKWPERACDNCGGLYRGPAVYCSLDCALQDAG